MNNPSEMKASSVFVTSAGIRTRCLDWGRGSPVLFVHGNPDSADLWQPLMAALQERHRCIAPDLPGFGQSDRPADVKQHCTLDSMANWLDGVLDAMAVNEPVDLVVHDVGGFYGLAWLARNGHRVRRVVITNTLFHQDYRWHFWGRVWRTPVLGELAMAALAIPVLGPWMGGLTLRLGGPLLSPAWVAHTARVFRNPKQRAQVLALYRAMDPKKFGQYEQRMLEQVAARPSLVFWGDRDIFIGKEFAERFDANEVHHFPDAGHWVAVEKSADLAPALSAFLAS